jgi:arylsulfatase A-like enzyme
VLNVDLAPTLLDFAGADIPRQIQGRSWKPVLEGKDRQGRTDWLYEYFWEKSYPFDPTQYGVRTQRYKYIRYPNVGNKDPDYPMQKDLPYDELYDLENDPLEMRNLGSDPATAPLLAKMKDLLKRRLDETEYPGGFRSPDRLGGTSGYLRAIVSCQIHNYSQLVQCYSQLKQTKPLRIQ